MTPEDYKAVRDLFHALSDLPPEEGQAAFVSNGVEPHIRSEVESLLRDRALPNQFDQNLFDDVAEKLSSTEEAGLQKGDPGKIGSYFILHRLGEGGMGVVYAARREDSQVVSAVKLLRNQEGGNDSITRRFARESAVLQKLRHPGIAAFQDAGEALVEWPEGPASKMPYLAMEYIEGDSLLECMRRHQLTIAERVEMLAQVCDALDHAHQLGVVHRDLKPDNIMVPHSSEVEGPGQPKILDFGVARASLLNASSETMTVSGMVIGTVLYMSPEQVEGNSDIDARSDIYSLGVLLFEALTGELPLPLRGASLAEAARRINEQDPPLLSSRNPDLKGPLEVIVGKALEKNRDRRFDTAADLARDLRAFNAQLPIEAQAPSTVRHLTKWSLRHPALATGLLVGLLAMVQILYLWKQAVVARDDAVEFSGIAKENEKDALRERSYVLRLADLRILHGLVEQADSAWPVHPDLVDSLRTWLASAEQLAGRLADHQTFLERLRGDQALRSRVSPDDMAWWIEALGNLTVQLVEFADPESGLVQDMRKRLQASETIEERSLLAFEEEWDEAIYEVEFSDHYDGLKLELQMGLVPIGVDPHSKLWEFWHVESGTCPTRDSDGKLVYDENCGIVLVLVPGGSFLQGAQAADPHAPQFDQHAKPSESTPSLEVLPARVEPFLLSKFELMQSQWQRVTGSNPSIYQFPLTLDNVLIGPDHPVEQVSQWECEETLRRWGLCLPSEKQWEYACRAGTSTRFWSGDEVVSLKGVTNLIDESAARTQGMDVRSELAGHDDGYALHAPVHLFLPNPFGFHHMMGNVAEWTADAFDGYWNDADGPKPTNSMTGVEIVVRGGSCVGNISTYRCSNRIVRPPKSALSEVGVRAARKITSSH